MEPMLMLPARCETSMMNPDAIVLPEWVMVSVEALIAVGVDAAREIRGYFNVWNDGPHPMLEWLGEYAQCTNDQKQPQ